MRGWPLIRLLVIVGFLTLLGFPVYSLTRQETEAETEVGRPPAERQQQETVSVPISIEAVSPLESFTVSLHGDTLLELAAPGRDWTGQIELPVSESSLELVVRATTPTPERNAVRLDLEMSDRTITRTLWGEGEIADVLPVPAITP